MGEQANESILITVLEDAEQNNFTWTKKATKLFLEAYLERKEKFRNPEVKKRLLWSEIAQILKGHGYINIDEDILDRKMRNMKRTYKTIRENSRKSATGRVSWEYYKTFQEIFSDLDSTKFSPESKNKLFYTPNKKQIEIEERKMDLINQVKETLEESNRIQQERNDLIRQLILSQFHSPDK
nr:PREDICTED: uncharacterized protein LOC105677556 [Linepithema humile]